MGKKLNETQITETKPSIRRGDTVKVYVLSNSTSEVLKINNKCHHTVLSLHYDPLQSL